MRYTGKEKIKQSDIKKYIGLTIKSVDTSAVNVTGIEFTNGTKIIIETEAAGHGIYAPSVFEIEE